MRNVPFLLFYRIKISELKAPALVAKYRDFVQTVGGGKGQVMDIAVIHEIQDDEEEENDNQ